MNDKDIEQFYTIIPEGHMEDCAAALGEEGSSFSRLLKVGQEFRDAGATPMYLLDNIGMKLFVVAEETFRKKLH